MRKPGRRQLNKETYSNKSRVETVAPFAAFFNILYIKDESVVSFKELREKVLLSQSDGFSHHVPLASVVWSISHFLHCCCHEYLP